MLLAALVQQIECQGFAIPDHVAGVIELDAKRLEAAVSFLVGLAGAAIVLFGDQAGAWLWVWDYLRWVSWPVRIGLALAIVAVSLPASKRCWPAPGAAGRPGCRPGRSSP